MDAIVFDWDGTLVDSMDAITRANADVLASYGLPYDMEAYREAYSPDWQLMYLRLGVDPSQIEEAGARWLAAYRRDVGAVRALPLAFEALERLAGTGLALGLVTAGERGVVEEQLESTGLGRFLPVRVCGGDLPVSKPHPAPLWRALSELGVANVPERTVYVGDALDDMRMARAVGARGVGIVSVLGDRAALRAAGAADVADTVAEWVDLFLASR